jgi:hypothetical protein
VATCAGAEITQPPHPRPPSSGVGFLGPGEGAGEVPAWAILVRAMHEATMASSKRFFDDDIISILVVLKKLIALRMGPFKSRSTIKSFA